MPRVPQHLPRSRNVPPRALEPSWKDLYSPKSPGKETWFPSRPPAQTLKTHWVRRASRLSNPKFPELGSKASSGCERCPVPPDRALLFPPPPPAVPSQPPENVRALSITSDVAVISWSEPPRSTLNGVLKGYRVIFWSLYVDGGESAGNVIGSQGERCGVGAGAGPHSVGAQHLPMGCQVEVQPLLRPCHSGPEPGSWGGRGGEGPSCS